LPVSEFFARILYVSKIAWRLEMQESFKKLEIELHEVLIAFVTAVAEEDAPLLKQIESHMIHEGSMSSILRETGEVENVDIRTISSESTLSKDTILYGNLDEILESFRPIGKAIATEKERMLFEALDEATKKTGNIVDNKGRPLTLEVLLEVIEKIPLDFDHLGRAKMPTMVVAPSMMEKLRELSETSETSEFKKKFERLISTKKAEWRAREADRILVG
jgi:Mg2+ and Co2+ transporter CorA